VNKDPHRDQPVLRQGVELEHASGLLILLHGRGGSAEDIMSLAPQLAQPGFAVFAPQAASNSWYPYSFMAPIDQNQPWLSSALQKVGALVLGAVGSGLPIARIAICGFSQGACLATEFVAAHPARYAALIAFTGGLIGPPEADLIHTGDLQRTPVFFGSGDPDPHVPWARVQQSANVLTSMNAAVTARRYPGRQHTIGQEEVDLAHELIQNAFPHEPEP